MALRATKPTRQVVTTTKVDPKTGKTTTANQTISAANAAAIAQQSTAQKGTVTTIPGGLTQDQYKPGQVTYDASGRISSVNGVAAKTQEVYGQQGPTSGASQWVNPFTNLQEAQAAAQQEYIKYGAVSPETEAAIAQFENPSSVVTSINSTMMGAEANQQPYVSSVTNPDGSAVQSPYKAAVQTGSVENKATMSKGSGGGVIEQQRQLRQQGLESKVDANGNVVITGASTYAATGEKAPLATQDQVAQNAGTLKGIMNAKSLEQIASEGGTADLAALGKAGVFTVGDLLNRGMDEVDGSLYLRNSDGSFTQLPSDVKEQLAAAESERNAAAIMAKAAADEKLQKDQASFMTGQDVNKPAAPPAKFSSIIAGMPAEVQGQASQLFGPEFQAWADEMLAGEPTEQSLSTFDDVVDKAAAYVSQNMQAANRLTEQVKSFTESEQSRLDELAKQTKENSRRDTELAEKMANTEYDRLIRDQEIQNLQDEQTWMNHSGISGAWKSTRHSADIIRALDKGRNKLADIRQDKIFNIEAFANKFADIEQNYYNKIKENSAAAVAANLNLQKEVLQDTMEQNKLIFDSAKDANDAKKAVLEKWAEKKAEVLKDRADREWENYKLLIQETRLAKSQVNTDRHNVINEAYGGMNIGLNRNPAWVESINKRLAAVGADTLPSGFQTDAQIKEWADRQKSVRESSPQVYDGIDYSLFANNVARNTPAGDRQDAARNDLFALLEKGDVEGFVSSAISTARASPGNAKASSGFGTASNSLLQILPIQQNVRQYSQTFGDSGKWKQFLEQTVKKAGNVTQDLSWLDLQSQLALAVTEFRHSNFGTQLPAGEIKLLENMLPMAGDKVGEMVTKMNNFEAFVRRTMETNVGLMLGVNAAKGERYNSRTGRIIYDPMLKEAMRGIADQGSTPSEEFEQFEESGEAAEEYGDRGGGDDFSFFDPGNSFASNRISQEDYDFDSWQKSIGNGIETAGYDSPHVKLTKAGGHGGIDIDGKIGDPISPFIQGRVISAFGAATAKSGYGVRVVILDDEGIFHQYAHLSSISPAIEEALARGEQPYVSRGDTIGLMGNSGFSIAGKNGDGSHLDYRAKKADGEWINIRDYYKEKAVYI